MGLTIEDLLDVPFFVRTREEKQKIIEEGKPRPPFTLSIVTVRQTDSKVLPTQSYDQGLYDLLPWLTRCHKRRSFFCWPCLLFMPGKQWSETGVPDGQFLAGGVYDHEASAEHIQAMVDWKMFIVNHIKPQKGDSANLKIKRDAAVRKNREILKRVIDSVISVAMRTQPSKESGYCNQLSRQNCISVLEMLRIYDIQFVDIIDDAICLLHVHSNFVSDIVDAITNAIISAVKKEAQLSTYVSIILSEHSEISSKSQISTILRYLKAGNVCERFIGFINMPKNENTDPGLKACEKCVSDFAIKERFLAYSIDGAVVHPTKVRDLHYLLKTKYPYTFFVPNYSHKLDYVLQQSLSHIKECGLLFKVLNEIGDYFEKNSSQWKEFEHFMLQKMPYLDNTKWFKKSQLVKVVNTYRKYFIEYFENIELNCKATEAEDLVKIHAFRLFLEDFENVFLLRLLAKVFEATGFISTLLKSETPESAFGFPVVEQLERSLRRDSDAGFEKLWLHIVVENVKEDNTPSVSRGKRKTHVYRDLHSKIVSLVVREIKSRFNHLGLVEFCHILNYNKCNQDTIDIYINKLMLAHEPYFDKEQLKLESTVLQTQEIAKKPIHELLEFFFKANLKVAFPYLSKLAELILTLPFRKASSSGSSKLKQIKKWSYFTEEDNVPGDASVLFVEKDFLQELKKTDSFHDEVIHEFNKLSNYVDLMYV